MCNEQIFTILNNIANETVGKKKNDRWEDYASYDYTNKYESSYDFIIVHNPHNFSVVKEETTPTPADFNELNKSSNKTKTLKPLNDLKSKFDDEKL